MLGATPGLAEHLGAAARRRLLQFQLFEREKKLNVYVEEIELNVEELEAMIAPGTKINHNETVEADLRVEELEQVIAPGIRINHNETVVVELTVEELEAVIAPALNDNHNETLASYEVSLEVEEMEQVIAPGIPLI
jgi:hypothetical protein